jgi:hypothetical protein
MLGFPQGEFKNNLDAVGGAAELEALYCPMTNPFSFGLELGYLNYGSETRREPFSSTIPDVQVDVSTTNNIVLGHFLLRAQRKTGMFRPYLDGIVGINYLYTRTSVDNIDDPDFKEVTSSTNLDDVVFCYGGGGGLMIKVYSGPEALNEDKNPLSAVLIDFRVRYLAGGLGEYLKEGSVRREGERVIYDINKSRTDLLTFQLGVVLEF